MAPPAVVDASSVAASGVAGRTNVYLAPSTLHAFEPGADGPNSTGTLAGPAAIRAGATASAASSETNLAATGATVPTLATPPGARFAPATTNAPPPSSEPTSGATLNTRVAGRNSNTAGDSTIPPSIIAAAAAPSSRAGVSHVANADDVTRAATTGAPPNAHSVASPSRACAPVRCTTVPPEAGPADGARAKTRGATSKANVATSNRVASAAPVTSNATNPGGDSGAMHAIASHPTHAPNLPLFSQTSAAPSIAPSFRAGASTSPKRHASASAAAKPTPRNDHLFAAARGGGRRNDRMDARGARVREREGRAGDVHDVGREVEVDDARGARGRDALRLARRGVSRGDWREGAHSARRRARVERLGDDDADERAAAFVARRGAEMAHRSRRGGEGEEHARLGEGDAGFVVAHLHRGRPFVARRRLALDERGGDERGVARRRDAETTRGTRAVAIRRVFARDVHDGAA